MKNQSYLSKLLITISTFVLEFRATTRRQNRHSGALHHFWFDRFFQSNVYGMRKDARKSRMNILQDVFLQKMLQYSLRQEGSSEETDPTEQSRWVNLSVPRLKDTLWCTGGDVKLDLWQDTMSIKWAASRAACSGPLSDSCGVFDVGWGDCDGRRGRPHDALSSVFRFRVLPLIQ